MGVDPANFNYPLKTTTELQTMPVNCAFIILGRSVYTSAAYLRGQMSKTEGPESYHFPHFLPESP